MSQPKRSQRVGLGILAVALGLVVWRIATQGAGSDTLSAPLHFDFESDPLARFTSLATGAAQVRNGTLQIAGLMNRPLWLQQALPHDVRVKVKARALSPEGDVKIELFGDGHSGFVGDPRAAYTATGYILVMGGWHNTVSAIARQHEHGHDRAERADFRVEPGRWYEWVIERRGGRLSWAIDGQPFLELNDAAPLYDEQHRYFAFSDWTAPVEFDELTLEPL